MFLAKLTQAGIITGANATVVVTAINAGMTAVAIIGLVG